MSKKTDLCWFLESGDINKARKIIESYVTFDELLSDSYILGSAILSQNIEIVRYVLDLGVNVNLEANEDRLTPILIASTVGDLEIFKLLVDAGANINFISDQGGDTAVSLAAHGGFREIVEYLYSHPRFDPETDEFEAKEILEEVEYLKAFQESITYDKNTCALVMSAFNANLNGVSDLINSGVNVNGFDELGRTALCFAAERNHKEMIRYLLESGADPNLSQPLHRSIGHGDIESISILLDAGAEIDGRGTSGSTALMFATMISPYFADSSKAVQFLIEKGADVNARDNNGMSVVDYAKRGLCGPHYQQIIMKLLKEFGAEGIE
jgi:ankyrin repeat protein